MISRSETLIISIRMNKNINWKNIIEIKFKITIVVNNRILAYQIIMMNDGYKNASRQIYGCVESKNIASLFFLLEWRLKLMLNEIIDGIYNINIVSKVKYYKPLNKLSIYFLPE